MQGTFHLYEALQRRRRAACSARSSSCAMASSCAQVYEDTTGLRPGDPVRRVRASRFPRDSGRRLLGHIFDGLLRPLDRSTSMFTERGAAQAAAGPFTFEPRDTRRRRCSPRAPCSARCVLADPRSAVSYRPGVRDWRVGGARRRVCGRRADLPMRSADGRLLDLAMAHHWPVRKPRPVAARLPGSGPLVTGQRILDTLFPVARGGRAALPGGFGTGKTVLQEALAKWCDADVIVYVGCGERGNEMAEVLHEFPQLDDPRPRAAAHGAHGHHRQHLEHAGGRARSEHLHGDHRGRVLPRSGTARRARWPTPPVAGRRRCARCPGRLGELPGEAGYPGLSQLAPRRFLRARRARADARRGRKAQSTIIGAISPPAGDFSEPVTMHTKRYVRASGRSIASARRRASIPRFIRCSPTPRTLDVAARSGGSCRAIPTGSCTASSMLTLLEQQARPRADGAHRRQGRTAACAAARAAVRELVNEGVLRQSAMSRVDRYCSPARQTAILSVVMRFIELAERALEQGVAPGRSSQLETSRQRLQRLGEEHRRGAHCADSMRCCSRSSSQFERLTAKAERLRCDPCRT